MSEKKYTKQPEFKLNLKSTYTAVLHTDLGDIKVKLFANEEIGRASCRERV
mgnify:CR=1 FL=1